MHAAIILYHDISGGLCIKSPRTVENNGHIWTYPDLSHDVLRIFRASTCKAFCHLGKVPSCNCLSQKQTDIYENEKAT